MKHLKMPSSFWFYVVCFIALIFLYQLNFTWHETKGEADIPQDETFFLTIENKQYGTRSQGFDSLQESLKIWDFDKKKREVYLKFETLKPNSQTKVMMIYDQGFDSFEQVAEVLPVHQIPYRYLQEDEMFIEIEHINTEGDIYLSYKGKRIRLEQGKRFVAWSIDQGHVVKTTIQNHGLYKKEQFKLLEH